MIIGFVMKELLHLAQCLKSIRLSLHWTWDLLIHLPILFLSSLSPVNAITDDGVSAFAPALIINSSLTSLVLYLSPFFDIPLFWSFLLSFSNSISTSGATQLGSALKANSSLTELSLQGFSHFSISLFCLDLFFSWNKFGISERGMFAEALESNNTITKIHFWKGFFRQNQPKWQTFPQTVLVFFVISLGTIFVKHFSVL